MIFVPTGREDRRKAHALFRPLIQFHAQAAGLGAFFGGVMREGSAVKGIERRAGATGEGCTHDSRDDWGTGRGTGGEWRCRVENSLLLSRLCA